MYTNRAPNPRKRAAPGASPLVPAQQPFPGASDSVLRWAQGTDGSSFVDGAARGMNVYNTMGNSQSQFGQGSLTASASNAVARRPVNALVPAGLRPRYDWPVGYDDANFLTHSSPEDLDENDNLEVLLEKAQRAKRDAATKRKQIPPFVQKLSSFLNEQKNTDLIRWSEKGDSFIVLDEDEFAKTLIPELFKHNNYASFVRQLNMYGFHKRVGLSDNSMKASERKNKSPSEYYNPYFRKGCPDLLWLINKPKSNAGKKKKKEDGDGDSDEEAVADDSLGQGVAGSGKAYAGEINVLQRKDLALVRDELKEMRDRQAKMQTAIARIIKDQKELITRAVMFQQLHDRHDRSINLILSFLANVYRKSLEDPQQGGNVAELLNSIIPGANPQGPQGTVIDFESFLNRKAPGTPAKRAQKLLPPIPPHEQSAPPPAGASTGSASPSSLACGGITPHLPQTGTVTEVVDPAPGDTTSPEYLKQALQSNPQEEIIKIMEGTTRATPSASNVKIPPDVANTASAMTINQRTQIFNAMATQSSSAAPDMTIPSLVAPTPIAGISATSQPPPTSSILDGCPQPTVTSTTSSTSAAAAPIASSSSSTLAVPASSLGVSSMSQVPSASVIAPQGSLSLHNLPDQVQIDELQRLADEQASKLTDLAHLLGPLSPSGRIPGIDEHGNPVADDYFDQFLNPDAFPEGDAADPLAGFDASAFVDGTAHSMEGFSLDPTTAAASGIANDNGHNGDFSHASVSSAAGLNTPSPSGTEDVLRDDFGGVAVGLDCRETDGQGRETKRRKV